MTTYLEPGKKIVQKNIKEADKRMGVDILCNKFNDLSIKDRDTCSEEYRQLPNKLQRVVAEFANKYHKTALKGAIAQAREKQ